MQVAVASPPPSACRRRAQPRDAAVRLAGARAAPSAPIAAAATARYTVQVGAFADYDRARRDAAAARGRGARVHLGARRGSRQSRYYRLRIGPFTAGRAPHAVSASTRSATRLDRRRSRDAGSERDGRACAARVRHRGARRAGASRCRWRSGCATRRCGSWCRSSIITFTRPPVRSATASPASNPGSAALSLVTCAVIFGGYALLALRLRAHRARPAFRAHPAARLRSTSSFTQLVVVGLSEEFFFRGYLQTQLNRAFGRPYQLPRRALRLGADPRRGALRRLPHRHRRPHPAARHLLRPVRRLAARAHRHDRRAGRLPRLRQHAVRVHGAQHGRSTERSRTCSACFESQSSTVRGRQRLASA